MKKLIKLFILCIIGLFINVSCNNYDISYNDLLRNNSNEIELDEDKINYELNNINEKSENTNTTYSEDKKDINEKEIIISEEIQTISFKSCHGIYENEIDMYNEAEFIIIGKLDSPQFITEENSFVEGLMVNRTLGSYYSIVSFSISEILKGNNVNDKIDLLQPVAITRDPYNKPVKIKIRGYNELINDEYYLLYLKKLDYEDLSANTYGILAVYFGKIKLGTLKKDDINRNVDIYANYYYDKYDGDTDLVNKVQYEAINRYNRKIENFTTRINNDIGNID